MSSRVRTIGIIKRKLGALTNSYLSLEQEGLRNKEIHICLFKRMSSKSCSNYKHLLRSIFYLINFCHLVFNIVVSHQVFFYMKVKGEFDQNSKRHIHYKKDRLQYCSPLSEIAKC